MVCRYSLVIIISCKPSVVTASTVLWISVRRPCLGISPFSNTDSRLLPGFTSYSCVSLFHWRPCQYLIVLSWSWVATMFATRGPSNSCHTFDDDLFVSLSVYLEMWCSFLSDLLDECDVFDFAIHGVYVSEVFHLFVGVIVEGHWSGRPELLYSHDDLFVSLSVYLEMWCSFLSDLLDECDVFDFAIHGVYVSEVFHLFVGVIVEGHWSGRPELLY